MTTPSQEAQQEVQEEVEGILVRLEEDKAQARDEAEAKEVTPVRTPLTASFQNKRNGKLNGSRQRPPSTSSPHPLRRPI